LDMRTDVGGAMAVKQRLLGLALQRKSAD